jgi:hypothetical protein
MKSLLAGIVLVGLMAASFPVWAQDSISAEIDISALPGHPVRAVHSAR